VNFDGFAEKFATALIQWADTLISSNWDRKYTLIPM
jgi:hypothetical protein